MKIIAPSDNTDGAIILSQVGYYLATNDTKSSQITRYVNL